MSHILIYTPEITPRLKFVFGLIFRDLLLTDFELSTNKDEFLSYNGPKMSYAEEPIGDELFCFSSQLLFEKGITDQQISVFDWEDTKAFFGTHPNYILPFDVFAASFYLVTRYEEYLPHIKDEHQRFVPKQSLALQKNFLEKPLVNIWANKLKQKISVRYPSLVFQENKFKFLSTIDVDSIYSFKDKGIARTLGGMIRSLWQLNIKDLIRRTQVLLGFETDPFDTFDYQMNILKKFKLEVLYFFLVGDYDVYDKNISVESRSFQKLVKGIADYALIGIHPSYASNSDPKKLSREVGRLSKLLNREITQSRQHFLKMTFPQTYRRLIELDILEDYTMGYASEVGFRASICTPYFFYDLDMEQETKLKIVPFFLMDGTLKDRLKLNPEESIALAKKLMDEVRNVNGLFVTLWHNHSFDESDEWKGWRRVYEEIAAYASKN